MTIYNVRLSSSHPHVFLLFSLHLELRPFFDRHLCMSNDIENKSLKETLFFLLLILNNYHFMVSVLKKEKTEKFLSKYVTDFSFDRYNH